MRTAGHQEKKDRTSITLQRSSEVIFKRPYEDMGDRNQRNVRRNLQDIVKDGWDMISKNQAVGSLDMIMKEIYAVKTDGLVDNMRNSIRAAFDQKNKNLLIQLLSLSYSIYTKKEMETIYGIVISWRDFKMIHCHAVTHGPGAVVPNNLFNMRNIQHRKTLIFAFVAFLVNAGIKTAEVVKRADSTGRRLVVAKIYRRYKPKRLISDFRQQRKEELQLGSVRENGENSVSRNYYSLSDKAMRDIVQVQILLFTKKTYALSFTWKHINHTFLFLPYNYL
jgi:hypothetical protein